MTGFILVDDQKVAVRVRYNARAKRLILRLDQKGEGVVVTLPKGVKEKEALKLAERNRVWIANQLLKYTSSEKLSDGSSIPFRGESHILRHMPAARGTVWREGDQICVAGEATFLERRLCDWLKKQAKAEITPIAHEMAERIHKKIGRISVRDTVSRWGSCSSSGNLSFNWRLILAPSEILEYVVAHEVSHLKHMDHSAAFWETVDGFDVNAKKCRNWLKRNGLSLQSFGHNGG